MSSCHGDSVGAMMLIEGVVVSVFLCVPGILGIQ